MYTYSLIQGICINYLPYAKHVLDTRNGTKSMTQFLTLRGINSIRRFEFYST